MGPAQIAFMALIILLYTFQNFFCNRFSLSYPGKSSDSTPVLTVIGGIVVAVITFFFAGCRFSAQPMTIVFGLINAAALYGYNYFLLKSSTCGPYSVLMVFSILGGIAVPSIFKWIVFDEAMTIPAIFFLVLVVVAVYLMSLKPSGGNDATSKITPKFIFLSIGLCLCNGSYASILACQQEITGESEKEELIIITFIVAAIISFVTMLFNKTSIKAAMKQTRKSLTNLLIYALSAAFAVNSLVIILLLEVNTGVLYTIQNAGVMLLSVVFSYVFCKERLTKTNLIGCAVMTIGLVGITVFAKTTLSQIIAYIM